MYDIVADIRKKRNGNEIFSKFIYMTHLQKGVWAQQD